MKKYIQYIFIALIAGLMSVSCIQELELETPIAENDVVTLVPRVQSFANKYVTKSEYSADEQKISNLTVLIFNADGDFACKKDLAADATSFTLNKSMIAKGDMTNSTVVMLANIELGDLKTSDGVINNDNIKNLTVSKLEASTYTPSIGPVIMSGNLSSGLPMIGGKTGVNLTSSKESQSDIEIGLKMLYAKINFQIAVAAEGSENQYLVDGVKFNMTGCSINNTTHTTTLAIPDTKQQAKVDFLGYPVEDENGNNIEATVDGATLSSYYNSGATSIIDSASSISKDSKLDVIFYILESRFNHGVDVKTIYPWKDAYGNVLEGYESYQQMYKPMLVTEAGSPNKDGKGLATNVRLSGTYTDYRGTNWNVDYTVYLGKDNAQNFQVDRNSEYTNIITIKGIRNSSSAATGEGEVWIDHRVNVTYAGDTADDCVTITRQTLIDSHIEVRPLRVKLTGSPYARAAIYLPKYPVDANGNVIYDNTTTPTSWRQLDENMGGANENWIAIENNNGTSIKGMLYLPSGKRKYFTTSLIEELHAESANIVVDSDGNRYISLADGDCAWIYFDENATANTRRAKIDVVFYPNEGTAVTESYQVYQAGYYQIGNLNVENYEEYLHSYDPNDSYDLSTSFVDYTQKGLPWGFESDRLSVNMLVSPFELNPINLGLVQADPKDYIKSEVRYDYFHHNDGNGNQYFSYTHDGSNWHSSDFGTGLDFTLRAANAVNNMTVTNMGTAPQSAYEYCLSKNKFNEDADGNHSMIIRWYLPDVYELESFFSSNHTLGDVDRDAYYWSSQPSFSEYGLSSIGGDLGDALKNISIKNEVVDKARAVSISGETDIYRTNTNRIRCFYDTTGETIDMSEKTPSGLGGILRIPMTVANQGFFDYPSWITPLGEEPDDDYDYNDASYRYPMGDTYPADDLKTKEKADNYFGGKVFDGEHYYTKNPLSDSNWGKVPFGDYTTYEAMHPDNWPGLTKYNTEVVALDRYRILTDSPKIDVKTAIVRVGGKITSMPNVNNIYLDHNEGSNKLKLSLSKGTNPSLLPTYEYYNETSASKEEWTKYWEVPTYTHIPSQYVDSRSCAKTRPTYNENSIKNAIQDEYRDGLSAKRKVIQGNPTFNYTETEYIYTSEREARTAAENYFNSEINTSGKFKASIQIKSSSIHICTYSYKGQTYKLIGGWKDNGEKGTDVIYSETRYTWSLSYSTIDLYQYQSNTGGWGPEKKTHDGAIDPAEPNIDALTFYGGNSLTISAEKCKIKSIKVNFSDNNKVNNVTGGAIDISYRYLRMVDANQSLPTEVAPQYMSYSGNGENGWYQWTAPGEGSSSVTLKLVAYAPVNNLRPTSFKYVAASSNGLFVNGYESDFETSIVIDSFEIRIEEVEE